MSLHRWIGNTALTRQETLTRDMSLRPWVYAATVLYSLDSSCNGNNIPPTSSATGASTLTVRIARTTTGSLSRRLWNGLGFNSVQTRYSTPTQAGNLWRCGSPKPRPSTRSRFKSWVTCNLFGERVTNPTCPSLCTVGIVNAMLFRLVLWQYYSILLLFYSN